MNTRSVKSVLEYLDIEQNGIEILAEQAKSKGCTMQELLRLIISNYIKQLDE